MWQSSIVPIDVLSARHIIKEHTDFYVVGRRKQKGPGVR